MKRIKNIALTSLILLFAIVVFATWQYRLFCLLSCVLINRKWLLTKISTPVYRIEAAILSVAIIIAIPNYFQRGRTRIIYIKSEGHSQHAPLGVYISNAIFPEEEIMNLAIKFNAIIPPSGNKLIADAHHDFWEGRCLAFYKPYNRLSLQGSNPGSLAVLQGMNQVLGTDYDGIYVTSPQKIDKEYSYPIVIFAHGFLGNWELYQGILSSLENCIVVSIGTTNLSGLFEKKNIDKIFRCYIPIIEEYGFNINHNKIHLIGLSNGGTISNIALRNYASRFKTVTFISTPCEVIKRLPCKVILIGGGHDTSSMGMPFVHQQLKRSGTQTSLYYDEGENHFIFAYQADNIVEFLQHELELQ